MFATPLAANAPSTPIEYRKLLRLFEGLKGNLKSLRSIIEDAIKGKEAYSLSLHCYDFEPVKKKCSLSVLRHYL